MSLQARHVPPIPEHAARVARGAFPEGSPSTGVISPPTKAMNDGPDDTQTGRMLAGMQDRETIEAALAEASPRPPVAEAGQT